MESFLNAIFFFFIPGLIIGWMLNARAVARKILRDPDKMIKVIENYKDSVSKLEELQQEHKDTPGLKVERHGDVIYLFRDDTNEFLAQGTTLQEALDLVGKRFPNKNFKGHLSKEQADELGIKI